MSGRGGANGRGRDGKTLTGPSMSSVNPGISAAGEAAGRTALDPSAGRAAIGGMWSIGEIPDTASPGPGTLRTRLSMVVSEITKLADALQRLTIDVGKEKTAFGQPPIDDTGEEEKDSTDTAA
jgi:hypothetical protein